MKKTPALETWTQLTGPAVTPPKATRSIKIFLGTWANEKDKKINAHYDRIELDDLKIFADGFESPDVSSWN